MRGLGDQGAPAFGRRRPTEPEPAVALAPPEPAPRAGVLAWAIRTAALTGFLGAVAAQYLAHTGGPGTSPVQVAAGGPLTEPETTGSIDRPGGPRADLRGTRLDPCTATVGGRGGRPQD